MGSSSRTVLVASLVFTAWVASASAEIQHGLKAEYFSGMNFEKKVLERIDPNIDFHWSDAAPASEVPQEYFSVRWTGWIRSPEKGRYSLILAGDNGFRLTLDGKDVINTWDRGGGNESISVELTGKPQKLKIEYFQGNGGAWLTLRGEKVGSGARQIIPTDFLFPDERNARSKEKPRGGIKTGLMVEYFDTAGKQKISFDRVHRTEAVWGDERPMIGVPHDALARYTGFVIPPKSGNYKLFAFADNHIKVWIDGNLLIDTDWGGNAVVELKENTPCPIQIDYVDYGWWGSCFLHWVLPGEERAVSISCDALFPNRQSLPRSKPALRGKSLSKTEPEASAKDNIPARMNAPVKNNTPARPENPDPFGILKGQPEASPPRRDTGERLPAPRNQNQLLHSLKDGRVAVGPHSEFQTISSVLNFLKSHSQELPQKVFTVTLLAGTYHEALRIDTFFPARIHLEAAQGQQVILKSPNREPIIRLQGSYQGFGLTGVTLDANSGPVAMEISGMVPELQLRQVTIQNYSETGILAQGITGGSETESRLAFDRLVFRPNSRTPRTTAIFLRDETRPLINSLFKGLRFYGPMAAGIASEASWNSVEIVECLFHDTQTGILLSGKDRLLEEVVFASNTFYLGNRGIVFSHLPSEESTQVGFCNNLFYDQRGSNVLVEKGHNPAQFFKCCNQWNSGIGYNWTTNQTPLPEEVDLFTHGRGKCDAKSSIRFQSLDPASHLFLVPASQSPHALAGTLDPRKYGTQIGAFRPQ